MNKSKKVNLKDLADTVFWKDMAASTNYKELVEKYRGISVDTFRFALVEKNRKKVVDSALKSLQKTDPNATVKQAETLADMMRIFARMVIKEVDELKK
ncbi:hypothetical protein M1116_03875 [Patescibacteria group bacterium]|nr:hypothetical protein [Patescibacteria group bacterium]